MIQKHHIEACEHAYEYWKQNKTHTSNDRELCLGIAKEMMQLIKSNASVSGFQALEEKCEKMEIDKVGHGGFGLHSAIIAVLSDFNV